MVHWDNCNNVKFKGDKILLIHVLFNLIKNALHYIRVADKGEIYIWCEPNGNVNELFVKDTGAGIASSDLPHIFERFYSKTKHGTGVGLAFCKMVMKSFGGDIICRSKKGEFTKFILSFPKL